MDLAEVFPSNYIKAADLKGRAVPVVIAGATIEKLGEDRKLVLTFQGKEKGLVTNKTNASRIAYLYGNNTDDWMGKEIVLKAELVDFQGKTVEAIRVQPPERRAASANEYATRQTSSGVVMHERVPQPTDRVPGSASTSVDLDQEIPF